jgi:hypothetical protein
MSEQTLTRRHLNWKRRDVRVADYAVWAEMALSDLLVSTARDGAETLYMLDTRDLSDAWLTSPADQGWRLQPYVNESDAERGRHVHVGYHAPAPNVGCTVTLRNGSSWFPGIQDGAMWVAAWERLRRDIKAAFDPGAEIVSTPGRTGNDLLERTLPRSGVRYDRLPDDALDMIYSNCGQGRLELFPHEGELAELVCLDGRWMYAACCTHLPSGPMTDDRTNEPPGYTVGFIQADVQVPKDWAHIGLLPKLEGSDEHPHRVYPRTPGEWFTGWFTTAEAMLAIEMGWRLRITQRLLWPKPTTAPADSWVRKLRAMRETYEAYGRGGDTLAAELAGTVRRMHIQAIGTWFRHEAYEYGRVTRSEAHQIPVGAEVVLRDGIAKYRVSTGLSDAQRRFQHPEWAATVWGRCRARTARAALLLPYEDIVSIRTDAIWLTHNPGWLDDGHVGSFRVKPPHIAGPIVAPQTEQDMRLLLAQRGR